MSRDQSSQHTRTSYAYSASTSYAYSASIQVVNSSLKD